ncbi:MAG: hypothetical protein H0X73_08050 [Chthoniobacterales bacterium]|nr:hypothetical protein [Chthoniobacterales bacterium]
MLADGLRATGYAGKPKRYFCEALHARYGAQHHLDSEADYARYLGEIVRAAATRNGVFGCKLMGWDLLPFVGRLRRGAGSRFVGRRRAFVDAKGAAALEVHLHPPARSAAAGDLESARAAKRHVAI